MPNSPVYYPASSSASHVNLNVAAEQSAKPRIMIVEDDEDLSNLLSYIFQRDGYQVLCADDGLQAAQFINSTTPPDIVLLDISLPFFDGFQLLALMRSMPAWSRLPISLLSGKSSEQDIVRALEAGANEYIVKPFQPAVLLARLRRLLPQALLPAALQSASI